MEEDKSKPDSESKNNDDSTTNTDSESAANNQDESKQSCQAAEAANGSEQPLEPKEEPVETPKETETEAQGKPSETSEPQQEAEAPTEVNGWLQKRTKGLLGMSCKWEKNWFQLKGTDLLYGENQQSSPKKIPLGNAEITESDIDDKTYAFGIKPKDSKRTYYLHAENEEDQQKWMDAICMAKLSRSGEGGACMIQ